MMVRSSLMDQSSRELDDDSDRVVGIVVRAADRADREQSLLLLFPNCHSLCFRVSHCLLLLSTATREEGCDIFSRWK